MALRIRAVAQPKAPKPTAAERQAQSAWKRTAAPLTRGDVATPLGQPISKAKTKKGEAPVAPAVAALHAEGAAMVAKAQAERADKLAAKARPPVAPRPKVPPRPTGGANRSESAKRGWITRKSGGGGGGNK